MTEQPDDLKELEALLGHTKVPYGHLQHDGSLSTERPWQAPTRRYAPYAVAASLTMAIGFVGLAVMDAGGPGTIPQSRLATSLPSTFAAPKTPGLTINANAFSRVRQIPAPFQMPTRPNASKG
ncbi:MAG: hypothetical protein AAFR39_11425 [Pseudomonadota bacterium]